MDLFISPRELADVLGVSESSLKRWVDAGRIPASRTSGGHRRIARADAIEFVRRTGVPIAHPERLGLTVGAAVETETHPWLADHPAFRALVAGDLRGLRTWTEHARGDGLSLVALCDGPLRAAMHAIGALWEHDADGLFIEHRATDLCMQLLVMLRASLPLLPAAAPRAVGGAPEGDPYILPSAMAALVLADAGYETVNLGADTPTGALRRAIAHDHPRVVWISASTPLALPHADELGAFLASLSPGITAVAGGRASQAIAQVSPAVRVASSMTELLALVAAASSA